MAQNASEMETRLLAGRASSRSAAVRTFDAVALTPSLRYANRHFKATTSVSALLADQRWQVGDAEFSTETSTPIYGRLRGEVLANASRIRMDLTDLSQQLDVTGRLHLVRDNGGVWLGSGVVHPLRVATVSNVNVSSGGVWTRLGSTTIRASVTNFAFTKLASNDTVSSSSSSSACPVTPTAPVSQSPEVPIGMSAISVSASPTSCRRPSRLTDIEGGIRWEHRLMELSVRGGQRFGSSVDVTPASRAWGSAQAAVWISNQMAAVFGGGHEPAQPTRGLPARNFYSMGLMLAYWPIPRGAVLVESPANLVHAFEMRPAGVALQRLTARIGGVEKVEIMGDFTDWAPVPLVRRGRDQWELLVPMSAGIHQINMRIDGGRWISPPGVPTIRDDFNGEVGVLVIKS